MGAGGASTHAAAYMAFQCAAAMVAAHGAGRAMDACRAGATATRPAGETPPPLASGPGEAGEEVATAATAAHAAAPARFPAAAARVAAAELPPGRLLHWMRLRAGCQPLPRRSMPALGQQGEGEGAHAPSAVRGASAPAPGPSMSHAAGGHGAITTSSSNATGTGRSSGCGAGGGNGQTVGLNSSGDNPCVAALLPPPAQAAACQTLQQLDVMAQAAAAPEQRVQHAANQRR